MQQVEKGQRCLQACSRGTFSEFDTRPEDSEVSRSTSPIQGESHYNHACTGIEDGADTKLYLTVGEMMETKQERVERWKNFFNNRPLMRCLDSEEEGINPEKLFHILFEEVRLPIDVSHSQRERQARSIAFWQNVRDRMYVDDTEVGYIQTVAGVDEAGEQGQDKPQIFTFGNRPTIRWWGGISENDKQKIKILIGTTGPPRA